MLDRCLHTPWSRHTATRTGSDVWMRRANAASDSRRSTAAASMARGSEMPALAIITQRDVSGVDECGSVGVGVDAIGCSAPTSVACDLGHPTAHIHVHSTQSASRNVVRGVLHSHRRCMPQTAYRLRLLGPKKADSLVLVVGARPDGWMADTPCNTPAHACPLAERVCLRMSPITLGECGRSPASLRTSTISKRFVQMFTHTTDSTHTHTCTSTGTE